MLRPTFRLRRARGNPSICTTRSQYSDHTAYKCSFIEITKQRFTATLIRRHTDSKISQSNTHRCRPHTESVVTTNGKDGDVIFHRMYTETQCRVILHLVAAPAPICHTTNLFPPKIKPRIFIPLNTLRTYLQYEII